MKSGDAHIRAKVLAPAPAHHTAATGFAGPQDVKLVRITIDTAADFMAENTGKPEVTMSRTPHPGIGAADRGRPDPQENIAFARYRNRTIEHRE
jgi:hypothetical protein